VAKERGLGRGFDALLPTDAQTAAVASQTSNRDEVRQLDPASISPNPHQPRKNFDQTELQSLAESIKLHGILQPLVVSSLGDGKYELIAGERRLRAAKLSGQDAVPAIVRSFDEQAKLELALIENIQRAELSPIEEALAYRQLIDQFSLTMAEVAQRVGKGTSTVANILRLLNLPQELQEMVSEGALSEGHARQVLAIEGVDNQMEAARLIIENNWTARQAEEFVRAHKQAKAAPVSRAAAKVSDSNDITRGLEKLLSTKVRLQPTAKGGRLMIEYKTADDLERIYKFFNK
jgi:ParB family chromosome partitioning protein